jgi:class 3 adenylate cyclase/tetratricopeptide (TPR) repeat protein
MDFYEVINQICALLRRRGRVAYRALQRQFDLDDADIEALKDELIYAQRVATDEGKRVLVWAGESEASTLTASRTAQAATPPLQHNPSPMAAPLPSASPTLDAERRQLTVMFCDLVDSTQLSGQLDPEDLRDVIRAYQETAADVIQRYEGHIAQYLGDGLLVYFGWPQAHEDDAQRAIHAGRGIVEAILTTLNPRLEREKGVHLMVRLGVHTGPVVVGAMGGGGRHENLATGETVNIAARLEGLAAPNTVVISAATRRLVEGTFELVDLGAHALKGVLEPMPVYGVCRTRALESRFEAATMTGLTPLVGREEELGLLQRRWEQAKESEGQVVLLCGEPGIGKSRLAQALREQVTQEPHVRLRYQCSPYYTQSAFYPIIAQIERAAQLMRDDTIDQKLDKLEVLLGQGAAQVEKVVPLFAALLAIPSGNRYPLLSLTPQRLKERIIEALAEQLLGLARRQPVLFIWEDAHWSDPTSLEVLDVLIPRVVEARVLVVMTYRPEFAPLWSGLAHVTTLTLNRMTRRQAALLAAEVTGGKALPSEVLDQIVAKTDGVPLFVEELTKTVLEAGFLRDTGDHYALDGPLPPLAIPSTLHDSLMARLDRLSPVKEVAQICACIGREFAYDLLRAVSPLQEPALQAALDRLLESGLIWRRGPGAEVIYVFKHALVQDAAYESLLKAKRQQWHNEIARALEQQFPDVANDAPELIAHHYTAAGLHDHATPYWRRAGDLALARLALPEAVSHLSAALEFNGVAAPSTARDRQELEIRNALGAAYMALLGWTAPNYEMTVTPAVVLGKKLQEPALLLPSMCGLWLIYACRAQFDEALQWVDEMLTAGAQEAQSDLAIVGHMAATLTYHWMGNFVVARSHCDRVVDLYNVNAHHHLVHVVNHDPKCLSLAWASHFLWMLGYPEQAAQASDAQLSLARRLGHAFNLGFSLTAGSGAYIYRREPEVVLARCNEGLALAQEQGLPVVASFTSQLWACEIQLNCGLTDKAYRMAQSALAWWRAGAAEVCTPYMKTIMGVARGRNGHLTEGLALLDEALHDTEVTGDKAYWAESYRLKGELLCLGAGADPQAAEACFRRALDIARSQQAKGWELRAATSLARLWQSQGKCQAAYDLLAPVYNWFTEGFDTADLKDARVLLGELS